jgi:hypothetical protein
VTLSDSAMVTIRMRGRVIGEIISTEETYVAGFATIVNVLAPSVASQKLVSAPDAQTLFKDIQMLHGSQNFFLERLRTLRPVFETEIARVFLEFAPVFGLGQAYVSHYESVTRVLARLNGRPKFVQAVREKMTETGGRNLGSFLITPVQRSPRYLLFIKELIKFTPRSHPDAVELVAARERVEQVIRKFDDQTAGGSHGAAEECDKRVYLHGQGLCARRKVANHLPHEGEGERFRVPVPEPCPRHKDAVQGNQGRLRW